MSNKDMSNRTFGIKGILQNLEIESFKKMERFWLTIFFSAIFAVLVVISCVYSEVDILKVLDIVTTNALAAFPSLIGSCITAYALILGFVNPEILEDAILTKRNKLEGEADTFYIFLSSNMSIYILFFIISFILTYIVNIIVKTKFTISFLDSLYILIINGFVLFIILSLIVFSFMLMMDIIYMIYNYSVVYIRQYSKTYQIKKNKKNLIDAIYDLNEKEQKKIIDILQEDSNKQRLYLKEIIDKIDDDIVRNLLDYIQNKHIK